LFNKLIKKLLKIKTILILCFLLVSLIVGFVAFYSTTVFDEINSKKQSIIEINSYLKEQQTHLARYQNGNLDSKNQITLLHEHIQTKIDNILIDTPEMHQKDLLELKQLESITYQKQFGEEPSSISNLINTRDSSFDDFLRKNNAHIIRVSEYKKYWGDESTNEQLDKILVNIDKERTFILNFDVKQDNYKDVRQDFRDVNDDVVNDLVSILGNELDLYISSIPNGEPNLIPIKNSLIAQREITSKITSTTFPEVNKKDNLAGIEPTDGKSFTDAKERTILLGAACENNVHALEDAGLVIRERHNVKEVGENKNSIQVLFSVIKCQQGLRVNAEDFMNSKLSINYELNNSIFPAYEKMNDLTSNSVLFYNDSIENKKLEIIGYFIATILFILIFGWFVSNTISKPINNLRHSSREIANGDFNVNIDTSGSGEILELQKDLKKMSDSLAKNVENVVELKIAKAKAEKLKVIDRQKEEFTSMMTHEFKTPLTPIMMWSEMFASKRLGNLSEKQEKAINVIHSNSKILLELISDMLDVQKLDLNEMRFNKTQSTTKQIVNELIENYSVVLKENNIEFDYTKIEEIPVITDTSRIQQVLRIFITNAMDFVPKNDGKIEIKVENQHDGVYFWVIDNGVGISKEHQEKLFHKFYQVDSSFNRRHGGTGLGLAISKGIATSLGGEIGLESEINKGSKFFIKIPKLSITKSTK